MKIKVVIPNSGMSRCELDSRESMLSQAVSPETKISVDCITQGPEAIESNTDEALVVPNMLELAKNAEKDGFDAFVVYCFSDAGIDAIRENLRIPAIGPGECSMAVADIISNRFCVITTLQENISRTRRRLLKNPIARYKMSSVKAIDMPVITLRTDPEQTMTKLLKICSDAVEREGIDTVILGCLGLAQYGDVLEKELGVKTIDPAFTAVAWAEMAVRLRLNYGQRGGIRLYDTAGI